MVDYMDWKAATSSEVFCEYAKNEITKEQEYERNKDKIEAKKLEEEVNEKYAAFKNFEKFNEQIKNNDALREKFKQIKALLSNNPELVKKVDANFVNGVMLLDLEE